MIVEDSFIFIFVCHREYNVSLNTVKCKSVEFRSIQYISFRMSKKNCFASNPTKLAIK